MTFDAAVIRVAAIPAGHPYVQHATAAPGVALLDDPAPAGATDGRWWPPVMCDAAWVAANADAFDVMHVHFGTESYPTAHLAGFVDALRTAGKPLVYTLHDLENPQLVEQAPHLEHLDVLVPAATEVLTLTPGAAAEIARRWGRAATVVPHPHVLPLDEPAPLGERHDAAVIGVHLRDLRPSIDAVRAVTALLGAVDLLRARGGVAIARVHMNERVRADDAADAVEALVAAHPAAELRRAPRLDDAALARSIADLDVAILPYRSGTHSGWVELCWDLGVPVAGPRVGVAGEQHPESFAAFDAGDAAGLAAALESLLAVAASPGTGDRAALVADRAHERVLAAALIAGTHAAVYGRLTAATERAA